MRVVRVLSSALLLCLALVVVTSSPAEANHNVRHGCSISNPEPPVDPGLFAQNQCHYRPTADGSFEVISNGDWFVEVHHPDSTVTTVTSATVLTVGEWSVGVGMIPAAYGDFVRFGLCRLECADTNGLMSAGDNKIYPFRIFG